MKSIKERIDEFIDSPRRPSFSCLSSTSKIKTTEPLKNEYVSDWESGKYSAPSKDTYLLLDVTKKGKIILSGSGSGYKVKPGDWVELYDDGNKTTGMPFPYDHKFRGGYPDYKTKMPGRLAKVVAVAVGVEEIGNFPKGTYTLWVMK